MPGIHIRHDIDGEELTELIFGGELVVFPAVPGLDEFRERVDTLIRAGLADRDPPTAQFEMDPDDYSTAIAATQRAVRRDEAANELLRRTLRDVGIDPTETYWDWIHLRALPHGSTDRRAVTGWHRDTWASRVSQQLNWWTPIYPVTAGRTIAFLPSRWNRPVANTSRDWDVTGARAAKATPNESTVPLIPEPAEALDDDPLPVVVRPGDLLCFSGAQLHGTVPNRTGVARFSVEIRTVRDTDVRRGRGAPDIDGEAPTAHYEWFRHMEHGEPSKAP